VTKSAEASVGGYFYALCLLLKCKNGFYLGCIENLKNRSERHRQGYVPAAANRLPVILDFYIAFKDKYTDFNFEKYLKTGSGRASLKEHMSAVALC
jgi:predicted GIY-YIG superfamily endonuclease